VGPGKAGLIQAVACKKRGVCPGGRTGGFSPRRGLPRSLLEGPNVVAALAVKKAEKKAVLLRAKAWVTHDKEEGKSARERDRNRLEEKRI